MEALRDAYFINKVSSEEEQTLARILGISSEFFRANLIGMVPNSFPLPGQEKELIMVTYDTAKIEDIFTRSQDIDAEMAKLMKARCVIIDVEAGKIVTALNEHIPTYNYLDPKWIPREKFLPSDVGEPWQLPDTQFYAVRDTRRIGVCYYEGSLLIYKIDKINARRSKWSKSKMVIEMLDEYQDVFNFAEPDPALWADSEGITFVFSLRSPDLMWIERSYDTECFLQFEEAYTMKGLTKVPFTSGTIIDRIMAQNTSRPIRQSRSLSREEAYSFFRWGDNPRDREINPQYEDGGMLFFTNNQGKGFLPSPAYIYRYTLIEGNMAINKLPLDVAANSVPLINNSTTPPSMLADEHIDRIKHDIAASLPASVFPEAGMWNHERDVYRLAITQLIYAVPYCRIDELIDAYNDIDPLFDLAANFYLDNFLTFLKLQPLCFPGVTFNPQVENELSRKLHCPPSTRKGKRRAGNSNLNKFWELINQIKIRPDALDEWVQGILQNRDSIKRPGWKGLTNIDKKLNELQQRFDYGQKAQRNQAEQRNKKSGTQKNLGQRFNRKNYVEGIMPVVNYIRIIIALNASLTSAYDEVEEGRPGNLYFYLSLAYNASCEAEWPHPEGVTNDIKLKISKIPDTIKRRHGRREPSDVKA